MKSMPGRLHQEPTFELLPRARHQGLTSAAHPAVLRRWQLAVGVALVVCLALGGRLAQLQQHQAEAQRQAQAQRAAAASAPADASGTAPLSEDQRKAQALAHTPLGQWLRELETCHPKQGLLLDRISLDAANRQATVLATAGTEVDVDGWMGCLNQAAGRPGVWQLRQVSASSTGLPGAPGMGERRVVVGRGG